MKKRLLIMLAVVLVLSVVANISVITATVQTDVRQVPDIFSERRGARKIRSLQIGSEAPQKLTYLYTQYASLDRFFDQYAGEDDRNYWFDNNGNFTGYSVQTDLEENIEDPITVKQATRIADDEMRRLFGDQADGFEAAVLFGEQPELYQFLYYTKYGFINEKTVAIDVRKDGIVRFCSFPNFYDFESFDPALLDGVEQQMLDNLFVNTARSVYGEQYHSAQVEKYDLKKTEDGYEIELFGEVAFGEPQELKAALTYRYALG